MTSDYGTLDALLAYRAVMSEDVDEVVAAIERARYEALLGKSWEDLREHEQETRLEVGRKALEASGVLDRIRTLSAELADARAQLRTAGSHLEALRGRAGELDAREADLARRWEAHARAVESARAVVLAAQGEAAAQAARADAAEDVIRGLRRAARPAGP